MATTALRNRDESPAGPEVLPQGSVWLHPQNRLITVSGATLLVNPETGNWLRLSPRGADLLRTLGGWSTVGGPLGAADAAFAASEVETFVSTLVRGRFARRADAWQPTRKAPASPACDGAASGLTPATHPRNATLSNVMLNVTHGCNLRCPHCAVYAEAGRRAAQTHVAVSSRAAADQSRPAGRRVSSQPSTQSLLKIIDRLAELGTKGIILFGGEPLLRKDITQVLRFASERIPTLGLATNGTLLSDGLCRLIVKRVREVRVSLDGSCPEVNDEIRGAGSFQRTLGGIQSLVRLGHPGVIVKTVVTQKNLADVPNMVRLARKLGAGLELADFIPLGRGALGRAGLVADGEQLLRTHQCVWLLADYYGLPSASFNAFCTRFMVRAATSCGVGAAYVLVDCSGDVFPCEGLQYWPLRLGNVLTAGNGGLRPLPEVFDASVERRPGCAQCELRHFCKGGCLAEAYAADGGARSPSSLCGFYRRVLPPIVVRFRPEASSWHNLHEVFGDDLDFSMVRPYLERAVGRC